jgi:hypothetical protein
MKHVWLWWTKGDVDTEWRQAQDEGRDLRAAEAEYRRLQAADTAVDAAFQEAVNALLDRTDALPVKAGYAYEEPSDLAGIRRARPAGPRVPAGRPAGATLEDKVHGAWLGRCAGCLLGKPLEGVRTPALWGLLRDGGKAMLDDYLWRMDLPKEAFARRELARVLTWGEAVQCMPEDDDTNYTTTGLALVKAQGLDFTPEHVADFWMAYIPILRTCTAERVAYRNFVAEIAPPRSAAFRNPYREWIGAQIRADFFGYVAPGRPELAAELAWRDASISHVRNGIYGEMWVAAMLAAAAVESDVRVVVTLGLSEVPARSRFAEGVRDVLAWHAAGLPYAEAVRRIHARWDETVGHHWCHTISNAQIVAAGLLWSGGEFERGITQAVYACLDTDCNGATVGSVLGMVLGARALPRKWTELMHDTVQTGVMGYHTARISDMAREMAALAEKRP